MKKQMTAGISAMIWLAAGQSPAGADEFSLQAPINAVKVHLGYGAIVTRQTTIDLPRGEHQLTIENLTRQLNEGYGLRATVSDGEGSVTQVRLKEQFTTDTVRQAQQALLDRINALEAAQKSDQTALAALEMQLRFIENIARANAGASGSPAGNAQSLQQSFDFMKTNSSTVLAEKSALETTLAERKKQIDTLRRELQQGGGAKNSVMAGEISISTAGGPTTVAVTYLVDDVSWNISTQANLDTAGEQTSLKLFANVSQASGEDWTNIPLVLSTTRPSYNVSHTQPRPVYYNLQDNNRLAELSKSRRPAAQFAADSVEEVIVTGSRRNSYFSTDYDGEFIIAGQVTVPSDNTAQTFLMAEASAPASIVARVSPNWEKQAYVYADSRFADIPTLEQANASLTRDGTYIGTGTWPALRADETLKLPFGQDKQIDVKVIRIPSEDGDTGIFNRRQVTETKQQFQVTNRHAQPAVVEVYDVRPNSMNEDLEIEALRGSTRPTATDIDGQPGVVLWRKELAPGETWEINHWYRMSHPADKRLTRQ